MRRARGGRGAGGEPLIGATTEWIYFSTALREFNIPRSRLEAAIVAGTVRVELIKNPHYRTGPPARLVRRADIEANVSSMKRTDLEVSAMERRRDTANRVAEVKRERIRLWVDRLVVKIRHFESRDALTAQAVGHYNRLWAERGDYDKTAAVDADPQFLRRITLNFLRHECTHYEDLLAKTFGNVGAEWARESIRQRVNDAILEKYPFLREKPLPHPEQPLVVD